MSYNISFGAKFEGVDRIYPIGEPSYPTPTYNIGEMLRNCMNWNFHQGEWYRVSECYDKIKHGHDEIYENECDYTQYNAPNGWGTTESAKKVIDSLLEWIDERTNEECAGEDAIPKRCLYMRWGD